MQVLINAALGMQDYCGLLSEEAVRKNFLLVYELLDEVIDYGYPQNSSSEALKEFVLNDPTVLRPVRAANQESPCMPACPSDLHQPYSSNGLFCLFCMHGCQHDLPLRQCLHFSIGSATDHAKASVACACCQLTQLKLPMQRNKSAPSIGKGPTGVIKSVLDTSRTGGARRDEIFVDIVEKISCTFNAGGILQTSQVDGSVQVLLLAPTLACLGPSLWWPYVSGASSVREHSAMACDLRG